MADTKKLKRKTAIALEYDPEDAAPKILASGQGVRRGPLVVLV